MSSYDRITIITDREAEVFIRLIEYALWAKDHSLPSGISEEELLNIKDSIAATLNLGEPEGAEEEND